MATQPSGSDKATRRIPGGMLAFFVIGVVCPPPCALAACALPAPEEEPPGILLVEGQVTDSIGSGLAEAKVELFRKTADGTRGELLGGAATDELGDFKIEAKEAALGEAILVISREMFKDFVHELTLSAGDPPYVAATLMGSVTLRGEVKSALAGTAVTGANVKLTSGYQDWFATSGEEGKFEIEGVYPGAGELVIEADGFGRERTRIAQLEAGEPVIVELKPERTVKLTIVDDRGEPIPGVAVELADQTRGDFRLLITDERGSATATKVHFDAANLSARLEHEGHVPSSGFDRPIELPKDEAASEHKLVMQRAARVAGLITDAKSGEPVYGARVIVGPAAHDQTPRDWTDSAGKYEVIGVPPGEAVVTAHMAGFAPEMKTVNAQVAETATLNLTLSPPATIKGRISDTEGKPIPNAEVTATAWRGHQTLGIRAMSDEEGQFTLTDAPHDLFEVAVYAPGAKPKVRTLCAADPQPIEISVEASPQPAELQQLAVGAAAPALKLKTLAGETIELSSLRGKVVLIDFWATWCGPCLVEIPHLVEVHKKFGKRDDFVMLGVSRDFAASDLTSFLKGQPGMQWPQAVGLESGSDEAADKFGVSGIPALFLINRAGVVAKADLRAAEAAKAVEELLKEEPGGNHSSE